MATYYLDFTLGDDSQDGTEKTHTVDTTGPWKHCPGMSAFTGSYVHSAGDIFVFKGGETWPASVLPLEIANSGSVGNVDKYTIDLTWYSGSAWVEPVFDFERSVGDNWCISTNEKDYLEISYLKAYRGYRAGIKVHNSDNVTISYCKAYNCGSTSIETIYGNPVTEGWTWGDGGIWGYYSEEDHENITITNCEIRYCSAGIHFNVNAYVSGVILTGWSAGIHPWLTTAGGKVNGGYSGLNILNNDIQYVGAFGIMSYANSDTLIYRGNTVKHVGLSDYYDMYGIGIYYGSGGNNTANESTTCEDVLVEYNYVDDIQFIDSWPSYYDHDAGQGIRADYAIKAAIIRLNVVKNCDNSGISESGWQSRILCYSNLLVNCNRTIGQNHTDKQPGAICFRDAYIHTPNEGMFVFNNTIIGGHLGFVVIGFQPIIGYFYNNIVKGNAKLPIYHWYISGNSGKIIAKDNLIEHEVENEIFYSQDMDINDWTNFNGTPNTNDLASEDGYLSRHVIASSGIGIRTVTYTTTLNQQMKHVFLLKVVTGRVLVQIRKGNDSSYQLGTTIFDSTFCSAFERLNIYCTADNQSGSGAYVSFSAYSGTAEFYISDFSVNSVAYTSENSMSDPFVDYDNENYLLLTGSNAIDAGGGIGKTDQDEIRTTFWDVTTDAIKSLNTGSK